MSRNTEEIKRLNLLRHRMIGLRTNTATRDSMDLSQARWALAVINNIAENTMLLIDKWLESNQED